MISGSCDGGKEAHCFMASLGDPVGGIDFSGLHKFLLQHADSEHRAEIKRAGSLGTVRTTARSRPLVSVRLTVNGPDLCD